MSSEPTEQYRMKLNNIKQAGHATFEVTASPTPPANSPTWVAVVKVTSVSPKLSGSIYVGTEYKGSAGSKSAAKDLASQQMLSLFASYGVYP
ncbi:hypothetical protein FS837_005753 [Tulasnella sp. UAMH 9824]|nr:hypothetical protein FS837_005753 [Tulasnella sp. UAMH 9824]